MLGPKMPVVHEGQGRGTTDGPRTVNLTILRFAVANGHIPASPTDRIDRGKPMLAVDKAKLVSPVESAESVGRLLGAIREIGEERDRPGLYGLFATLVYTGLRRGEACGLRWSDVDFDRRLITVRRSYEGRTKSGKDRLVPISAELVPILQQHKLADPWKGSLVFPDDNGEICPLTPACAASCGRHATAARSGESGSMIYGTYSRPIS